MDTRFFSRQNTSSTSQPKGTSRNVKFRDNDSFNQVCNAVRAGNSVIVLGEAGTGKTDLAQALYHEMLAEFNCAIATYKGSLKRFFQGIAMQLDCPTHDDNDKALTVDALKEEILINSGEDTLLVFPEAKRLTTSIRYWLEDMISAGARVVCFAVANPGKDIFLEMLEIELELPSDRHIREVMEAEARKQGLQISKSRLAELQPLAGRNPMLARKIIRNEKLGIKQDKPEHTQYVVIMPIIIAASHGFWYRAVYWYGNG